MPTCTGGDNSHPISHITGLQAALDAKEGAAAHDADVANLQGQIDALSPVAQLIYQDVLLSSPPGGSESACVDLSIPVGKTVMGSGVGSVDPADGVYTTLRYTHGPHLTDSSKWRFNLNNMAENGGYGWACVVRVWIVVV